MRMGTMAKKKTPSQRDKRSIALFDQHTHARETNQMEYGILFAMYQYLSNCTQRTHRPLELCVFVVARKRLQSFMKY